ncbi:MAG: hypothetical protein RR334_03920, partial [Clostridia bacterium]
ATYWWERSSSYNSTSGFCSVSSGGLADYISASNSYGVAFGFCLTYKQEKSKVANMRKIFNKRNI